MAQAATQDTGNRAATGLLQALWPRRHAALVGQLALRQVQARSKGSMLGMAWLVLTPLLMLAVYTVVLRHVMGVRWAGTGALNLGSDAGWQGDIDFALRLYAGLAVFTFVAECWQRSPRLVVEVPHLVKKVVFPLEVLPWVNALASLSSLLVAVPLLLLGTLLLRGEWPLSALALPLVWLPLLPLVLGLGWLFCALGTYLKDTGEVLALALGALLFLSPVFYEQASLPAQLQGPLGWNPLALVMTQTRQVLLHGAWPDWQQWLMLLAGCSVMAVLGAAVFERLRPGFADVV